MIRIKNYKLIAIKLLTIVILLSRNILSETQIIEIEIKEHKFIPDKIYAKAGNKIKLIIHNRDKIVEEFESHSLNREKIIPGGTTGNIILAPLKPGEYKFFGEFHEATAQGVLIVEDEKNLNNKEDNTIDINNNNKTE